ncbi:serine/threonine protein kinase [Streptomyces nigrescens]|uniref:non-specific serine/threonine protein kinase n=2 Tax=Streptomyces nigrescens TaxID=1920 RepID=A0A640TI46_STRNI|nr:serine/threonine protein kinase [Streptomyces libani subsp. libani]GGV91432.1 serine/threonine protein kinase [Streptomyces libani subsp. libani]
MHSHMPPALWVRPEHGCGRTVAGGLSTGAGDYRCALDTYGFPEGRAVTEAASVDEGRLVAGRYRLVERIGQGGMGTVWRARDEVLGRQVAVKRLHVAPYLDADELARRYERTTREAQAAARINHPNVVGVHDVVDDAGMPCIVMEYVPSTTLGDLIKEAALQDSSVTPREAARIGRGMVAALRAAHSAGVLHRDVKPGNVLLGEEGRVVLTDFGIAVASGTSTLTKTGELVGSIDYLAPERVRSGSPGPASDLWALGATLYQAVEGRPPFRKDTAVETAYAIAMDPLEAPRNAGVLTPLIEALLAKEPADRPTAEVVEQALRAAEADADTALYGRPTLALGTVGRGTPETATQGEQTEAPTRPVPHTGAAGATSDRTGTGTGTGTGTRAGTTTGARSDRGSDTDVGGSAVTGPMALPDGAVGRRADGDRTEALSGGKTPRRRRVARVVVWSVVGLLFAGGGAGTAWYLMRPDEAGASNAAADKGTPKPSGVPDNSIGPPPPLPDGYRKATESAVGVTLPVPKGWQRKVDDSGRQIVYYSESDNARLTLSVLDFSSGDHVQHFKDVEAAFKANTPVYSLLRMQKTVYQGEPAAVWEYTFGGRARTFRTYDLGFGREGGKEYAIAVTAPEANWTKFGSPFFSVVRDGFRRTDPKS